MRIEKCGRILDYLYYIRNYFTTLRGYSVSGAAVRLEIERIYVLSGWKHYARDRKTLRQTFVSSGIMFFSLKDIFSWGFIL